MKVNFCINHNWESKYDPSSGRTGSWMCMSEPTLERVRVISGLHDISGYLYRMFYAVSDDAMLKMQKIAEMADAEDWTAAELILKLAQYNSSLLKHD